MFTPAKLKGVTGFVYPPNSFEAYQPRQANPDGICRLSTTGLTGRVLGNIRFFTPAALANHADGIVTEAEKTCALCSSNAGCVPQIYLSLAGKAVGMQCESLSSSGA